MYEIDGSHGEGGGQLVRTAATLAALTGRSLRLRNIRARRPKPGLAAQHLTAVRAVAALCNAEVSGLELGSKELTFRPGALHGGRFDFDVGTAGSMTLVLQAVLPAAAACRSPVHLRLTGGTDVKAAPPLDYLRYILLPLLARMGLTVTLTVQRRGYYPRGGGAIEVDVSPLERLCPLHLPTCGPVQEIGGIAHVANLPGHIAARMKQAALDKLHGLPNAHIDVRVLEQNGAIGQGGAIVVWARTPYTLLGAATTAERGVPAEHLGETAAKALRAEITAGATVDIHASDQLLIYLARAAGPSRFLARGLSSHAETTLWLLQQFLPVHYIVTPVGQLVQIDIEPSACG
ncbi:MAG: RNA 3'-terminal phosphate cyclase [Pseudomonadota bacterium]